MNEEMAALSGTILSHSETTRDIPARGVNPEPDAGWSWMLTEYEIAYVQEFNSRPPRLTGWAGSERDEMRLDDEATGVRGMRKTKRASRGVNGAIAILTLSLILAATAGTTFVAVMNTLNAEKIRVATVSIEEQIHG